jgi:hypothetical protein
LDKLLEDVQNGLHPITAYHLLFPTQNTLNLLTKSSVSDKALTPSVSSALNPSMSTNNQDNDVSLTVQSNNEPLAFYSIDGNAHNHGPKSRTATTASTFERICSGPHDTEHHSHESTLNNTNNLTMNNTTANATTTITMASTTTASPSTPSAPLSFISHNSHASTVDEKEGRRIIDIQCKLKTKDTGVSMVIDFTSLLI